MKNIVTLLRSVSLFVLKLSIVAAFCLIFSFVFVYPLWLFAVKRPDAFSASVLILCLSASAAALAIKIGSGKKK
ncbi:hypothetical protein V1L52_05505 [Treponema sp. HNW]|uniref:hypothetical protein n=1 Tax=Treponema sp. HNW TaxID=3116654 RepID=UPI003D0A9375